MVDTFTVGRSKAAQYLMGKLNEAEYSQHSHKALKILSKYMQQTNILISIPDRDVRETCLLIWRHRFLNWIDECAFPIVITTNIKSLIVGRHRQLISGKLKEDWFKC